MKRKLIDKMTGEGTSLPAALKAVELSSSSYYYRPRGARKPRALDKKLVAAITAVRKGHAEVYGYRKIAQSLRVQGMRYHQKVWK
jgi:hypothetical protein